MNPFTMKSYTMLSTIATTFLFAVPGVRAWGVLGHQAVALLAQNYLLPDTVTKVQRLLNDTSDAYMGNVATWADSYRNQPGGGWSAGLHYINPLDGPPPESCVVHEMDCPEEGCVLSALANYTARVQDTNLEAADQAEALRFLIHFMGDIAQPLHTETFGLGVNNLTVFFNGFKTNMHSAWDTSIPNSILSLKPSASITMDDSSQLAERLNTAVQSGPYAENYTSWVSDSWHLGSSDSDSLFNSTEDIVTTFAQESNNYVCGYALSDPAGPDTYNGTDIGGGYTTGAVPIVQISLARAGIRLAAWLNLIFTNSTGFGATPQD